MSGDVAVWKQALIGAQDRFVAIASKEQLVDWARESMFALQALEKNDFLRSIAEGNPNSLRNAVINVAACGITLNPISAYAYLVPRDGAVYLDISYRGYLKIATDAGSILWGRAELVYPGDKFTYYGPAKEPEHVSDPFAAERGEPVGVYCIAKTVGGDVLCDVMTRAEVEEIRSRSPSYMKGKKSPWKTDPGEMWKKTVIRRARKTWPESKDQRGDERLQLAAELSAQADGFQSNIQPENGISPRSGALEALSQDERDEAVQRAQAVAECFRKQGAHATNELIASFGMEVEQHIIMWSLLDSKVRTALRKADTEARHPITVEHGAAA